MEAKVIIVSSVKSNKSNHNVWAVAVSGDEQPTAHCTSAYKAMRMAFLLKKRTGFNISENCLSYLSFVIAKEKAAKAAKVQEIVEDFCESHNIDNVLAKQSEPEAEQTAEVKPKRTRKPRTKKNAESAQVVALV